MTSLSAWGDVPNWIQALGGVAQLGHAVWAVQKGRAARFGEFLCEASSCQVEDLARLAHEDEALASLVYEGLEAAMRASTEDKLRLLAAVVADGFRDDGARVDELELLLRTASALEPLHVRVLASLAQPRPDRFAGRPMVGATRERDLDRLIDPDRSGLTKPVLLTLQAQGLVVDEGNTVYEYTPTWLPSIYGFRFLRYLGEPDGGEATLAPVHIRTQLLVKNLGPGTAMLDHVTMTTDGESLLGNADLPVTIGAGDRTTFPCNDHVPENGVAVIVLGWTNPNGQRVERETRQPKRRGW